jgi:hypothetical protein
MSLLDWKNPVRMFTCLSSLIIQRGAMVPVIDGSPQT